ncbi:MAG TPA: MBL fold metallo-hydrolase [Myxococcota bacterium]|nr:MBL fold metallo-hydrolase [Myxococcota bacterium]
MLWRQTFPVGALQCNCTLLGDTDTREAIVIDPGDEVDRILSELSRAGMRVTAIVHTHAHIDHVGATAALARVTEAPAYLHDEDRFLHDMLPVQAQLIGLPAVEQGRIDRGLPDATSLSFGRFELGVLHTPGHTPGSVCFTVPGQDLCFSGDTLFAGGIGRTDLWGGDHHAIERSIKGRLYGLNGAVQVIPGHGPNTSIDRERRGNPFIRA